MNDTTRILEDGPDALEECARLLRQDELVAVPTETVYGLAGNAFSEDAVRKIFSVKGRPLIDPLITHFKSAEDAFLHVQSNTEAELLAAELWPGPLTLVLNKGPRIPDLVTAGLSSAAVRVPKQPTMRALLAKLEFPLAAPSANPFGYVSPTRPEHVARTLGSKIAAILNGGICQHGIESTVLDLRDPKQIRILRPGPIGAEQIESIISKHIHAAKDTDQQKAQSSPGQLSKHYSPKTKIKIIEHGCKQFSLEPGDAIITNTKPAEIHHEDQYWLSEDEDIETITRNFFDLVQKLDRMAYKRLIIEAAPQEGLGIALNDRLQRAAAT